jgi:hypothetical protein
MTYCAQNSLAPRQEVHTARGVWHIVRFLAIAAVVSACGTPALRPTGLPLGQIRVVAGPEPGVEKGAAGKGTTAAVGAVAGGLAVGVLSAIPCLLLGPVAAPCLAAVPAAMAVGAAGASLTGAAMADDEETLQAKRKLLGEHLDAVQPSATLAAALRTTLGAEPGSMDEASSWRAQVDVVYLTAETGALDKPFRLLLGSTLTLNSPTSAASSASHHYAAKSVQAETLEGWQADGGHALRAAIHSMLGEAATRMSADLRR